MTNYFQELLSSGVTAYAFGLLRLDLIFTVLLTLARVGIPVLLISVVRKRTEIPYRRTMMAFGVLIVIRQVFHSAYLLTGWPHLYPLDELLKAGIALASVAGGIYLFRVRPTLMTIPSPVDLKIANDALNEREAKIYDLNTSLEQRVRERTAELARANRESAEIKTRLQEILDAALDLSIVATGTDGLVTVFSTGAEKMLQYQASEVVGVQTPQIWHLESEYRQLSAESSQEVGRHVEGFEVISRDGQRGNPEKREWTYVRKDGSTLEVRATVVPLRNKDGAITGFLNIASDISVTKALDRELRENNRQLLEETQRAAEANRSKSIFLASMSHEIRTPMNAILGMADLLWESQLDSEQRKYLEVFRRAGNNLLLLINDILDLSKIEAGRFELENIEFDLEEVVNRTLDLIRPMTMSKGIDLHSWIAPGTPTALTGDPARLQQVLINLLGNAVKFTTAGEVILTVIADNPERPEILDFAVSDTGIGIPPEMLSFIFDDFTQADSSNTRKHGGTGLGLGISRRLAKLMGGKLEVQSKVGEGSTFSFQATFDVVDRKATLRSGSLEDFHGKRVLVIDDIANNRLIYRETLSSWGFVCIECANGIDGIVELSKAVHNLTPVSLVILDRRMPGADGFQTADAIRHMVPNMPIVMLTSESQPGDATRCQELGISGYGVKPVKRTELIRLVCEALGSPQGRQPAQAMIVSAPAKSESTISKHSLRILVADDSPDNQILLEAYLKDQPYVLTFAEHGRRAVDFFLSSEYDLILMDLQMPVMDGLTAVRVIRMFERKNRREPTPIVALTANAITSDIEASLAAGCMAHITKPVSKQRLLSAIVEYARKPILQSQEPIYIAMPEGLESIVPDYLVSRREEVSEFLRLLAASDCDQIRVLAHNMKGSGGAYGFPELTEFGAAMEGSARDSKVDALREQIGGLATYLKRVRMLPAPAMESVR